MRYINLTELLKKRASWGNSQELWKNDTLVEDFKNHGLKKCWYTEVELLGQDPHIDHWRPKAEIKPFENYNYNKPLRNKGYDWLKNDPENYRVSCIYANRKTGDGGKGNYFPLSDSSGYLTSNGQGVEEPLLLDPCNENDVRLISFLGGIVFAASTKKIDQDKVKVSTQIYNIDDPDIKAKRQKVWDDVEKTIEEYNEGERTEKSCIRSLKLAIDRGTMFSACAIACIKSLAPKEITDQLGPLLDL